MYLGLHNTCTREVYCDFICKYTQHGQPIMNPKEVLICVVRYKLLDAKLSPQCGFE